MRLRASRKSNGRWLVVMPDGRRVWGTSRKQALDAARTLAPPTNYPSNEWIDEEPEPQPDQDPLPPPDDRDPWVSVRAASAGLPGLGKKR